MAAYKVFHFSIGSTDYSLKDRFSGNELENAKYYIFKVLTSDTIINFRFDTTITKDVKIDIFSSPTLATNGTFLYSPQSLVNIYSDPLISSEGTSIYSYNTTELPILIHTLNFSASTDYLLKITPLDTTDNILGLKSRDDVDQLKDILRSVNNIKASRLELMSIIRSINNNTLTTTDDIILALKKIAIAEKAILEMILNI